MLCTLYHVAVKKLMLGIAVKRVTKRNKEKETRKKKKKLTAFPWCDLTIQKLISNYQRNCIIRRNRQISKISLVVNLLTFCLAFSEQR